MKFNDTYNPSYEEILAWAYEADAVEPEQDWDIIVNWLKYPDLILKLASNENCPSQDYFLHILYVLVGQAIRGSFSRHAIHEIEVLFDHTKGIKHPSIQRWLVRSREVISKPELFVYDDWFSGKLARSEQDS